jgi:hypothetical protein
VNLEHLINPFNILLVLNILKEGITNRISERTTITLDNKVYSRLKKQGTFGDSFSSLVSRILDQIEGGEQP